MSSWSIEALIAAKRAIVEGLRLPFADGLRLEGRLFFELQAGPEAVALEEEMSGRYQAGNTDPWS